MSLHSAHSPEEKTLSTNAELYMKELQGRLFDKSVKKNPKENKRAFNLKNAAVESLK